METPPPDINNLIAYPATASEAGEQSKGGVYFHLSIGHIGNGQTAEDHTRYITRPDKTQEKSNLIVLHNVPEWVAEAREDYTDLRERLLQMAVEYHKQELKQPRRGPKRSKARLFYRAEVSFDEAVEEERAARLGEEYLKEAFPTGIGIAACHLDTDHTHVHFHIEARGKDGNKLRFSYGEFTRLDERWAAIFGREFGEKKLKEYLAKKAETKAAYKRFYEGLKKIEDHAALSLVERENLKREFRDSFRWPERARDDRERRREQERRVYEAGRIGGNQRAIDRGESPVERAVEGADRTLQLTRELSQRGAAINQRIREQIRERERGR